MPEVALVNFYPSYKSISEKNPAKYILVYQGELAPRTRSVGMPRQAATGPL